MGTSGLSTKLVKTSEPNDERVWDQGESLGRRPDPPKCSVIEVHVGELKQLFNAIDPSPFRDKDLDSKAEEFIVGWAKELQREATLALVV